MNKILIILFVITNYITILAQAPNAKEWLKQKKTQRNYLLRQIEALQVHLEYVKTGYKIVDKGLTTVGAIKEGTFSLDKDFFNSLQQVNPLIQKSPKVNEILVHQQLITNEFKKLLSYCKGNPHYTKEEINYITRVSDGMRTHGRNAVAELTIITTAGNTEMTDDERMKRLDKIHEEMLDQYAFTKSFVGSTKMVAVQRAKDKQQADAMKKLYNIHE